MIYFHLGAKIKDLFTLHAANQPMRAAADLAAAAVEKAERLANDEVRKAIAALPPTMKKVATMTNDEIKRQIAALHAQLDPHQMLGPPTYPSPGVGYTWMGAFDPSGAWREAWVYTGIQHATGAGPQPGESAMQYAQRMGVPDAMLGTIRSFDDVTRWKAAYDASTPTPPTRTTPTPPTNMLNPGDPGYPTGGPGATLGEPVPKPSVEGPVTDPARQKAIEIEAALIAYGMSEGSIFNNSVATPSELNNALQGFLAPREFIAQLQRGRTPEQIWAQVQGQRGFEAYTLADIRMIEARLLGGR